MSTELKPCPHPRCIGGFVWEWGQEEAQEANPCPVCNGMMQPIQDPRVKELEARVRELEEDQRDDQECIARFLKESEQQHKRIKQLEEFIKKYPNGHLIYCDASCEYGCGYDEARKALKL